VRRPLLAFVLVFAPAVSAAQLPRDTLNPTGMVGGVFWAPMRLVGPSVDKQSRLAPLRRQHYAGRPLMRRADHDRPDPRR